MIDHHPQRGSMLIYAMLTMAVMLSIGITLNALFINKLRLSAAARNAIVALYAADSGAELCIYESRSSTDADLVMDNRAQVELFNIDPASSKGSSETPITDCSTELTGSPEQFRSVGTFRESTRALEIGL